MAYKRKQSIANFISDRFASEWKLLSETEAFVSHTPDFPAYERQFMEWRKRLQKQRAGDTELVTVRSEIVTLRKALRLKGYDLSLGLQRIIVDGFRNDDSVLEGFHRAVVCFCDTGVYYATGSANHIAIAEELTDTLSRKQALIHPEMHFLWYRRTQKGLILSGSATETQEDLKRLEARINANPLKILSALKKLS